MKKVIALFLTVILAFSLLIGCGGKEAQTGTLTIMGNIKTENLDALVSTPHDPNLMSSVFGATIRRGENGLEPGIIENWSLSEDGLTTTFTIREGVKFSDGSDFTTDDVIFSLDKMNEDPMLTYAVGKYTWAKVDDLTFTMTAPSPLNDPATVLSTAFIVPSDAYDADIFVKAPIGAGPYRIDSIDADGTVSLSANEHYYGEAPHYKKLVIKAPLNPSAAVIALQNGEIDILPFTAADQLPLIRDDDHLAILETAGYTTTGIWFYGPLKDDANLRFAIAHAIDRDKLVQIACNGEAAVSNNLIAAKTLGSLAGTVPMPGYDVEKAKEYLAASNYKEGDVLTLTVYDKTADAQCIMEDLKAIGIAVEIEQMDMNSFYQATSNGNMGMCIQSVGAENATTAGLLLDFSSDRGENFVVTRECDDLIAQFSMELDPAKRDALYKQVLELQASYCNIAPLYEANGSICYRKGIEGLTEFSAVASYLYPELLK